MTLKDKLYSAYVQNDTSCPSHLLYHPSIRLVEWSFVQQPFRVTIDKIGEDEIEQKASITLNWDRLTTAPDCKALQEFYNHKKDDGFQFAWSDTCCIHNRRSAELDKMVLSMFRWLSTQPATRNAVQDSPSKRTSPNLELIHAIQCMRGFHTEAVYIPRRHYLLVLNVIPVKLKHFTSSSHLVRAMRDALTARRDAFEICGIPHLDINVGNIALRSQGCTLMDWDLATSVENSTRQCRTAREPFKSIRLANYRNTLPDFLDDMESILYVIMWFVAPEELWSLKYMIRRYSPTKANSTISYILQNSTAFDGDKALERLLHELAEVFASRYTPTKGGYEVYEHYQDHEDSIARANATEKMMQCLKLLESHAGIIKIFDEHLSNEAE